MFKKINLLFCIALIVILTGCGTYKTIPYMLNSESLSSASSQDALFDARIMPKDIISITVSTTDPEASAPFNLIVPSSITNQTRQVTSQPSLQQYLVENDGTIDFPVLGRLKIGGLTKREAEELIRKGLEGFLNEDPIINVRMTNYKISVLGEVNRPGTFTITNEKVNIFEALAMAGDLTIYGMRDNVKLVREDANGKSDVIVFSLNDRALINSPFYYLQQNDVIYITPNKNRAKDSAVSQSRTIWISVTSTLVSIATLLITILAN